MAGWDDLVRAAEFARAEGPHAVAKVLLEVVDAIPPERVSEVLAHLLEPGLVQDACVAAVRLATRLEGAPRREAFAKLLEATRATPRTLHRMVRGFKPPGLTALTDFLDSALQKEDILVVASLLGKSRVASSLEVRDEYWRWLFDHVGQVTVAERRAVFSRCARALPEDYFERALDAVGEIEPQEVRIDAWLGIADNANPKRHVLIAKRLVSDLVNLVDSESALDVLARTLRVQHPSTWWMFMPAIEAADPITQAAILGAIAPRMPPSLLERAVEIASAIEGPPRDEALASILRVTEASQTTVALHFVGRIEDERVRAEVLRDLLPRIGPSALPRLATEIGRLSDPEQRAWVFLLVARTHPHAEMQAADAALEAATEVVSSSARAKLLLTLSQLRLQPRTIEGILPLADQLEDHAWAAIVLAAMARALAAPSAEEALRRAMRHVASIRDRSAKRNVLLAAVQVGPIEFAKSVAQWARESGDLEFAASVERAMQDHAVDPFSAVSGPGQHVRNMDKFVPRPNVGEFGFFVGDVFTDDVIALPRVRHDRLGAEVQDQVGEGPLELDAPRRFRHAFRAVPKGLRPQAIEYTLAALGLTMTREDAAEHIVEQAYLDARLENNAKSVRVGREYALLLSIGAARSGSLISGSRGVLPMGAQVSVGTEFVLIVSSAIFRITPASQAHRLGAGEPARFHIRARRRPREGVGTLVITVVQSDVVLHVAEATLTIEVEHTPGMEAH